MKAGLTSVCLVLLARDAICSAQNWPQFRGDHAGVATNDPSLPDTWSETQNVAWKIFALSEDGDTFVIQAGPQYKLLGRNSLNEMALASPAVAGGSVFIRSATKLYRIAKPIP